VIPVHNRQLFVQVNAVLRARGGTVFVCECASVGCNALVELPLAVYDGTRAVGGAGLAEGHPAAAAPAARVSAEPSEHEFPALRESLLERVGSVWERLNDAVSELHEVHAVTREEIIEQVEDAIR
jgi:hypothetical protein